MSVLIITEKPKVARALTEALKTEKGMSFRTEGGREAVCYRSSEYIVTCARGHILELLPMDDYPDYPGIKGRWTLSALPYFPRKYQYNPKKQETARYELITRLVQEENVEEIVNACDADREGQIICDLILRKIGSDKKTTRMWYSATDTKSLIDSLDKRQDNSEYLNLSYAGTCRQLIDWAYGMNLSRYASLKSGNTLHVGRVKGAIINMIYERDKAIEDFVPEKYYSPEFQISEDVKLTSKKKCGTAEEADRLCGVYNRGSTVPVKITNKEVVKKRPKLFSQTKLQNAASRLGMDPARCLKTVQSLYESGYCTYPRTNSEYIAENEKEAVQEILKVYSAKVDHLVFRDNKSIFDSKKVESHGAIIPTAKIPDTSSLSPDERKIYRLIFNRFYVNFYDEDYTVDKTETAIAVVDGEEIERFKIAGEIVKKPGWSVIEKQKAERILPFMEKGVPLEGEWKTAEKETSPPKHYTIETLNNELLHPFRNTGNRDDTDDSDAPDDERYRLLLKGLEIGTEATRAGLIESCITHGYIEIKNKSTYYITEKGRFYVHALDDLHINLTKEKTAEMGRVTKSVSDGSLDIRLALRDAYVEIYRIIEMDGRVTAGYSGK